MKINQAVQRTGKSSSDIIIVRVGTINLSTSTPEEICMQGDHGHT